MDPETTPHFSREDRHLHPAGPIPLSLFNAHRFLVERFPISDGRSELWNEMLGFIYVMTQQWNIKGCELWIDGCFATLQPRPHTIFLLLVVRRDVLKKSALAKKYFSKLLEAETNPSPETAALLEKIQNAFGCTLHILLYTDDPEDKEYDTCQKQMEHWTITMSHGGRYGFIILTVGKGLSHE